LRDIFVTEYGIADLRGKTDHEIVTALVSIMDARFQEQFVANALRAGKLPRGYSIPERARSNRPEHLAKIMAPWRQQGLFDELPFGSELTREEVELAKALKLLGNHASTWSGRLALLKQAMTASIDSSMLSSLKRMDLHEPATLSQHLQRRLVIAGLRAVRGG
jgi:hypothetical protein